MKQIVSDYDQEIPQSQTADNPIGSRGNCSFREQILSFKSCGWREFLPLRVVPIFKRKGMHFEKTAFGYSSLPLIFCSGYALVKGDDGIVKTWQL